MRVAYWYIKKVGVLISLLLFCYLLNPFGLGHYFGYLLFVIVIIKKDLLLKFLDSMSLMLFLFSVVYALFYSFNMVSGAQYIFIYSLFPITFYLLGKRISNSLTYNQSSNFLWISAFVFSISALISVLDNVYQGGFVQQDRSLPMIWNKNLVTATIMGSFLTLNMCIPAILISRPTQFKLLTKIVLVMIFMASIFATLRLGSRTQVAIALITSAIGLAYVVPKQGIKKNVTLIFALLFGLILFIRNISLDLNSDVLTAFAGRMKDSNNNVANAGNRSGRWAKSIEYLFSHPLGWDVNDFGLSHNLWFDVLRSGSVIAFILLIIVFIKAANILKKRLINKELSLPYKVQILVYFVGFILIFMVEPILDGMTSLFILFCLYLGIINKNSFKSIVPLTHSK